MIRGRHRGLPVAIDRAVVLPYEFERVRGDDPDPPPRTDEWRSSDGAVSHSPEVSPYDVVYGQTTTENEQVSEDK